MLESLDWQGLKGSGHMGAGIFVAMLLSGSASTEWQDAYFLWLDRNVDSKYGIGRSGAVDMGICPKWHHLNDWFHFLFNYWCVRRPFPCAEKLIDTCIDLYRSNELKETFGTTCDYSEIDWVFALNRATWQTGYRFGESRKVLKDFAEFYIAHLEQIDPETNADWNDLHLLFGTVCALAELQLALPGVLETRYPLRQVLDRRPFI